VRQIVSVDLTGTPTSSPPAPIAATQTIYEEITSNRITVQATAANSSGTAIAAGPITTIPIKSLELPAAGPMAYFMGRLWYAQGSQYSAGDIVGNTTSGSLPYGFRDSVLKVTENPLSLGGDGFKLPSQSGDITALSFTANLNASLGQGFLTIFTAKSVYQLQVPVTRSQWISANNSSQPLQTVVQLTNGATGDRSVVGVNSDLFFQSLEPSVRSLMSAVRYFQQWGDVPIASNENRILKFVNRSLLEFATGIYFDNRMLQSSLPLQLPQGVVHQALMPLDFTPISTLESQLPPVWEGHWEGLQILQLFTALVNGEQHAYAAVVSTLDSSIQWWQLTTTARTDANGDRIEWFAEFPAFTWGKEFDLKKLVSGEVWIDQLFGKADFCIEYRPDGDPCWHKWKCWSEEGDRRDPLVSALQEVNNYPCPQKESFRATMVLPAPPSEIQKTSGRPVNVFYQGQCRLKVVGWCRVRGLLNHAEKVDRATYQGMVR
jgi:hypothetical protein